MIRGNAYQGKSGKQGQKILENVEGHLPCLIPPSGMDSTGGAIEMAEISRNLDS